MVSQNYPCEEPTTMKLLVYYSFFLFGIPKQNYMCASVVFCFCYERVASLSSSYEVMCLIASDTVLNLNALPPVRPAGLVVRRNTTSCPVQGIPF